ncbi:MAG: 3-deoxy-manno-octulosonate cytidylyltransferase [Bacteroidetes bacterium GWF2_33_16]|nr:MAG: 3-deoxy-manno-octulosonate cytidylyltransferase [Bacteroidetes bacterium GWE2_32_14]OFY03938.1 MAG: 3-deoxy-manno-octulosonate cytidylyltransferase [Bacteroidetes bacterium GWF2_33_16]
MNYIGIIPARYASTRFPGKPLADINGKSMIQCVYEQASKALNDVYVATDDSRIADEVTRFGGKVVMTSEKHQSGTDRIAEAIELIHKSYSEKFDVIINIQGDEPYIQPQQIKEIQACFDNPLTKIATLVKKIENNEDIFDINKPKVVFNKKMQAIYFSRSPIPFLRNVEKENWHLKHDFYKHIGMYAYKVKTLQELTELEQSPLELAESLEQLRWIENGYAIYVAITKFDTFGVDTPEDLEKILKKF